MAPDIALALGIFLLALAIPSIVAAFAEQRRPYTGLFLLIVGAGAIGFAWTGKEGGYRLGEIPMVFFELIAAIIR